MEAQSQAYSLPQVLTLYQPDGHPLAIAASTLQVTYQAESVHQCRLILEMPFERYQTLEKAACFNLKPEIRGPLFQGEFDPDLAIALEADLRADLVPLLTTQGTTPEAIATQLLAISQAASIPELPAPILTENWFAIAVQQNQAGTTVGYRTLWYHAHPEIIEQIAATGTQMVNSVVNFIKEAIEPGLVGIRQTAKSELGQDISQFLEKLSQEIDSESPPTNSPPIFEVITAFFQEDDWDFAVLDDERTLQMGFEGDHGRWTCFARALDEDEQFLFYSVCPIAANPEQLIAIAEFIARANFGLLMGNFELDFTDGEIRYKTSIDVAGDRLTPALVEHLVYTNVLTMDQYLPGLLAVLNNQMSPTEAVQYTEQISDLS